MEENDTECEVLLKHIANCQKGRVAAMERGMMGDFNLAIINLKAILAAM